MGGKQSNYRETAGTKSTREQEPGTEQITGNAQRTDVKQQSDKDKTKGWDYYRTVDKLQLNLMN